METATQNETLLSLAKLVNLSTSSIGLGINTLANAEHKYMKDLKINVSNALMYENLLPNEANLIALAVAINEKNQALIKSFTELSSKNGASESIIAEIYACVSLMNVNNVFYRFRHFTKKEYYENTPAGIKMSIMMQPVVGKEFFELLSLAISSLNGCELCVTSHEQSLIHLGTSLARIYDAVRLAAMIKGLAVLN
jgi:lipoyl-dependent peroxiredoxin subunit D